ncbi:polysaccharide biosynthesis tyrosine autokinase [Agrococcus sp. HG114]|uniref:polysaccharide biosynthesis tyrosine autokinase n=1 Tax=Agrococcus sp. HG114 TaxID=2969757 RepID=UPI00215ACE7B|nr:polysaccharide biosynthesis tyrosine autokinase [Agrococcus sp. HG114]MCR8669843.1 polysaccharide biosynthesis tyrosine autokinase [Agrococcus sp. HG114]
MELSDYIRIVRKYWVLLVAATLVGVGMGAIASLMQRPVYSASTQVFVSLQGGDTTAELAQGNTFTLSRVATYANLVDSQRVLDGVIESLGLDETFSALDSRVSATTVPETTIIQITATSNDPAAAAALADAAAASLSETVTAIEARPDQTSPVQLAVVERASVPTSPISPRTTVNIALGALIALGLAVGFALLREVLDTRIRNERDVRAVTAAPMLGAIAFDPKAKQRPLIVHADPLSPRSEQFRTLRTNLQFIEVDDDSRSIVVTSATPGEGKSTTTANLALAIADAGQTVILIDADLRKPKVAEYMNLDGGVGLTDVLIGRAELVDAVQQWGAKSLYVLPAGQIPPNPSELLGSKAMATLLKELQAEFDWVLFDAPPLLPVTDAAVLSKHVESVVIVASAGKATKHQLETAVQLLNTVDSDVSGVVLTMVPTRGADAYAYGHYGYGHYGYMERKQQEQKAKRFALPKVR